jgi:hypothetical protein
MGELTRWNLQVSRETDEALRELLASRGESDGDLSRFVEDAVNRAMLRQTLRDVRERNAQLDPDEVQRVVDEEVAAHRREWRARALE